MQCSPESHQPHWIFPVQELSTPQHTDQQQRAPQPGTPERSSSAAAAQPRQLEQGAQAGGDLPAYLLRTAFDVARCPVSIVKFARGSADLLAWGDDGGMVYVATAEEPPRLLQVQWGPGQEGLCVLGGVGGGVGG